MTTENPLYALLRANSVPAAPVLHIVSFKFRPEVSVGEQEELMAECFQLEVLCGGHESGIRAFKVKRNLDPRKGYTWVEMVLFQDVEALIAFHRHPQHQQFAQKMAQAADVWVVTDINVDSETHIR